MNKAQVAVGVCLLLAAFTLPPFLPTSLAVAGRYDYNDTFDCKHFSLALKEELDKQGYDTRIVLGRVDDINETLVGYHAWVEANKTGRSWWIESTSGVPADWIFVWNYTENPDRNWNEVYSSLGLI